MDAFALCAGQATGYMQQQQQHQSHQVGTCAKKTKVPREKLTDYEFDKIVIETSARLARSAVRLSGHYAVAANGGDVKVFAPGLAPVTSSSSSSPPPHPLSQPKRPMNAFMVWGQAIRRELHNRFSNVQNALLSKALGRVWKRLELNEKEPYISRANIIKTNHKRDYPDYRYQPRRIQEKQQQQHQQQRRIQAKQSKKLAQLTSNQQTSSLSSKRPSGAVCSLLQPQAPVKPTAPAVAPLPATTNRHQHQNQHQYYQHNQHLQTHHQSHQHHPRAPIVDNAPPKIIHHHRATTSGNFMGSTIANCAHNDQVPDASGPGNIYKSSRYSSVPNSMQSLSTNSSGLYQRAGSIPATIGEEATTCYSIYDSSPHYVSSSEASNDNHFLSKDLAPAVGTGGQLFNIDQQQQPKLFMDTIGQVVDFETSQQHVCPVSQCQSQTDHVQEERQNHHHQHSESNNDHDQCPSTSIANIISQQSNGTNSFEYQFYRQQHQQHDNNNNNNNCQRGQQIEQFEDAGQYRGYAEQVQSYPLNVCDTRLVNGRAHIITQPQIVTDYADHGGCQVKRENYNHMYRGYSDELGLV